MLKVKITEYEKWHKLEAQHPFRKPLAEATIILVFAFVLLLACAIPLVHAVDPSDQVSLPNLPAKLEEAFGITDASHLTGGILASLIFLSIFGLPIAFMTRKSGATVIYLLFVCIGVIGFSIAMTWLPIYFILLEGLIVALMFAGGIRDWISGK